MLDKVKKQLDTAGRTLEQTSVRSRAMERKLRDVAEVPGGQSAPVLELAEIVADDAGEPETAKDMTDVSAETEV